MYDGRTQDDLAIMIEGADGQYYLQAGAVLLAGTRIFLLFSIYCVLPCFVDVDVNARLVASRRQDRPAA
jgi:hypothetical protein